MSNNINFENTTISSEIFIKSWLFSLTCAIVSCYKEARHMNETLKSLYDRFYTPLPLVEYEQEVEACHHQLIERLEKPERKLSKI